MNCSNKRSTFLPLLCCAFLLGFGGCYTKLASYQNETMGNGGDCSDCGDEAPVNDRREVCVWERDIFGFPEMRCYTTNYSSSWMYFHSTPWWYRDSYRWYDTRGCPPNYYYDRGSGICRYYGSSNYHPPGGGGGGGSAPGKAPPRPTSRVIPSGEEKPEHPAPVTSGSVTLPSGPPMFSGGGAGKHISPVNTPAPAANDPVLSKEPEKQPAAQPSTPPPERKQDNEQPKQPPSRPPRPSSRGM